MIVSQKEWLRPDRQAVRFPSRQRVLPLALPVALLPAHCPNGASQTNVDWIARPVAVLAKLNEAQRSAVPPTLHGVLLRPSQRMYRIADRGRIRVGNVDCLVKEVVDDAGEDRVTSWDAFAYPAPVLPCSDHLAALMHAYRRSAAPNFGSVQQSTESCKLLMINDLMLLSGIEDARYAGQTCASVTGQLNQAHIVSISVATPGQSYKRFPYLTDINHDTDAARQCLVC